MAPAGAQGPVVQTGQSRAPTCYLQGDKARLCCLQGGLQTPINLSCATNSLRSFRPKLTCLLLKEGLQ